MTHHLLIIEDNADLARLVALHLRDAFYHVETAADGQSGLTLAESKPYDLIILDLMLPRLDGLEVCRRLRQGSHYVPILMLTSKATELDRVLGLETGADDYVTKPFSIMELLARVKAIFRRLDRLGGDAAQAPGSRISFREMQLDLEKRKVTLGSRQLDLTAKEFDLLAHFARHPGRVYSRAELLDQVWGYGHDGYEHTVNSHINRLRAKLERDPAAPEYVMTVWGVGYKFAEE